MIWRQFKSFFGTKESLCIGLVFLSVGTLFGTWAAFIPHVKAKLALNDAQLGLLLLSMPFGATVTNPLSTVIIKRFGTHWATVWALVFMAVAYTLPIILSQTAWVSVALVGAGVGISATNVAMNTAVTMLENTRGRLILSSCHGMFSIGGMVGAAMASMAMGLGLKPEWHTVLVSAAIICMVLAIKNTIYAMPDQASPDQPKAKFSLPNRILMGMVAISLCSNITEGTMADWASVYMKDVLNAPTGLVGWGFSIYAFFMAAGRFLGDGLIPKFGLKNVLIGGGVVSALGFLLCVVGGSIPAAMVGFGLVGLGVSCAAPILYGSASRMPGMAKGAGLATMNTFSIGGFLVGPAIIGFISKAYSLPLAFALVGGLGVLWAVLSKRNRLY